MITNSEKIEEAFRTLFQVWDGTEGADEVLTDALRTIAHQCFGLPAPEINKFENRCRGIDLADDNEAAIRENERLQRRVGKLPR